MVGDTAVRGERKNGSVSDVFNTKLLKLCFTSSALYGERYSGTRRLDMHAKIKQCFAFLQTMLEEERYMRFKKQLQRQE